MDYSVGQILFVLLKKERAVLPIRVVEQVVRQTIDEKIVSYMIMLPNAEETVMKLDKLDADVFLSIDDVRKQMIENATTMIEKIIENAENVKSTKFGALETDVGVEHNQSTLEDNEKLEITFEDGTKGKINMSNLENSAVRNK